MRAAVIQFVLGANGGAPKPPKVCVAIGNMHIVCGHRKVREKVRMDAACLLCGHLNAREALGTGMAVVRVIVGDDNLTTGQALEALHRETDVDPVWHVKAARAGGRGGHIAVSGAVARFVGIPVGKSFEGRGARIIRTTMRQSSSL